tara:strand:- start:109 stop:438 length:330 start_codon:yes stop_codon:yes gene_type:complete
MPTRTRTKKDTKSPDEPPPENLRLKLKATIEAKKLARLDQDVAYDKLKEMKQKVKTLTGDAKAKTEIMISVLFSELEKNADTYANACYGDAIEGGCGFGSGGGAGTDAG